MEYNMITPAGVRIFHAATAVKPVDIYIEQKKVISKLGYGEATEYLPLEKGRYNIRIYEADTGELLYNQTIKVDGDKYITLSAISETGKVDLIVVEDLKTIPDRFGDITDLYAVPVRNQQEISQPMIRFVHLSPNAPAVDLTLLDGTILFTDTKYKQVTNYMPIGTDTKTLQIRPMGTNQVVLSVPNVKFETNKMYTIYAIGLLNGTPKLEAVILRDGPVRPK